MKRRSGRLTAGESGTTPNTALQLSQMADAVTIDLVCFDS